MDQPKAKTVLENHCNHHCVVSSFYKAPETHYRPTILTDAKEQLEAFYELPKKYLFSLRVTRQSRRQERTEGRERDAAVLQVILHYTELASLRVGVPQENGSFLPLSLQFIADQLGYTLKRVWRCVRNLKKAGYLTIYQRYKKVLEGEQEYIGLVAVKVVSLKLFKELHIDMLRLERARKKAAARLKKIYHDYKKKLAEKMKPYTDHAKEVLLDLVSSSYKNRRKNNKNKNQDNPPKTQSGRAALNLFEQNLRDKRENLRQKLHQLQLIPKYKGKSLEQLVLEFPKFQELRNLNRVLDS